MNKVSGAFLLIVLFSHACMSFQPAPDYVAAPTYLYTPSTFITESPTSITDRSNARTIPMKAAWQIQYSGEIDYNLTVDVYNLDLIETDDAIVAQLHERDIFVMCYFSAGSYEDWRPDVSKFPQGTLGKAMQGWPGEKWLDIRQLQQLAPIMQARLDLAAKKGCDAVDPDNVNGYTNDSGFPLSYKDQLAYNIFLSQAAHSRGMLIGLKNDLEQINDLLPYYDWALNEECFSYNECDLLTPFIKAGKPVFVIEYEMSPQEFCPQANEMGFNAIQKNLDLDAFVTACR